MFDDFFLIPALHEIVLKNIVEPNRPQVTMWPYPLNDGYIRLKIAHSEYVISFPLEQWLHEGASILRYTYNTFSVLLLLRS